jgi:hypothetical protein
MAQNHNIYSVESKNEVFRTYLVKFSMKTYLFLILKYAEQKLSRNFSYFDYKLILHIGETFTSKRAFNIIL